MTPDILPGLACPKCKGSLGGLNHLEQSAQSTHIESGLLLCQGCGASYEIKDFVPRFVLAQNYANSFGFQWNTFRRTQLDSCSGTTISRKRFCDETGWTEKDMSGALTLDAGCGAGRFAEIALSLGARLFAIDYSRAADACWQNLGSHPNLNVFQADIYNLPFPAESFDLIYSLGVLQHTPDPIRAVAALIEHLKPGGRIVVDFYMDSLAARLHPKYLLRPMTTRMASQRLFSLVQRTAPALLSISSAVAAMPAVGPILRRAIPVANYRGLLPLNERQIEEWAILDTFDWLSPVYDNPQTPDSLHATLEQNALEDTEVVKIGHLVGRGRRPLNRETRRWRAHRG